MSVGVSRTSFSFQRKKGRPHNKHFGKSVRWTRVFKHETLRVITHMCVISSSNEKFTQTSKYHQHVTRKFNALLLTRLKLLYRRSSMVYIIMAALIL